MLESRKKEIEDRDPSSKSRTATRQPQFRTIDENKTPRRIFHQNRGQIEASRHKLSQLYEDLMDRSEYSAAQQLKETLQLLDIKKRNSRKRKLSQEHQRERKSIKKAHDYEMKRFRQAWQQVFIRQATEEQSQTRRFAKQKHQSQQLCRQIIQKKCRSERPRSALARLNSLEAQQKILRKNGATIKLKIVRNQKKSIIEDSQKEQRRKYQRIIEQQEGRMNEFCARRYSSFVHRVEVARNENKKMYRREEQRIKQKFKNMLKNLEHDQKMSFQQL